MIQLQGNGAHFSPCREYRYALWRIWNEDAPLVMFIGLNPSTANEKDNDPTIRRVMNFACRWGYGGVIMMNLFAWVTAYPHVLKAVNDPIGDNDLWLQFIADKSKLVVFAWGAFKEAKERAAAVINQFPEAVALKITADGSPGHPLYVPAITLPVKFKQ